MDKKHLRLGMNPSVAAHRLRMDILFSLVQASGHNCYRCGGTLTRETFSIDHKIAWLNSDDPKKNFFDLANIAFSHRVCNYKAGEKVPRKYNTDEERRAAATAQQNRRRCENGRMYDPIERRQHYLRTGN